MSTKNICFFLVQAIQMSTNKICFYKESQKNIAQVSLNTPLMKFSAGFSLKCTHIRRIFYYKFFK